MRAATQVNPYPPRYRIHARTNVRGLCGCRAMKELAKANTVGEATATCNRPVHRGIGDGTHEETHRLNWGPSHFPPIWVGGLDSESISCRVEVRGADEVVVSDDPAGQHNPLASQGPLDGRVSVAGDRATLNRKALERVFPSGITHSRELQLRWRISRSRGAYVDGT